MKRQILILLLLAGCIAAVQAKELTAKMFAATPEPRAMELMAPRALAVNQAGTRCYVLDSGLRRVLIATPGGEYIAVKALPEGIDPAESLLAVSRDAAYLMQVDEDKRKLTLRTVDGPGKNRVLAIPEGATGGAFTMDTAGRVLAAYLSLADGKLELLLARENDEKELATVAALRDPCEGQWKYLTITGMAARADGRVAIGIAQSGDPAYSFVRSWLIEAKLQGATPSSVLHVACRDALIDSRGRVKDRYRALVEKADRAAKPCVPLFAAPALGVDGMLVTGGQPLDPFLRVYVRDNEQYVLQSALRRAAPGPQPAAVAAGKEGARLFTLTAGEERVSELAPDGRVVGGFGIPVAYALDDLAALAADRESVYAAARWNDGLHLARFTADGRFQWARDIAPPPGMADAEVFLTAPAGDRVMIGWRRPEAAGLGWVDTMLDDGTPGLPLWDAPATEATKGSDNCPTPLITGDNGCVYLLRETADGLQAQAMSMTGVFMRRLPAAVQGITAVDKTGSLAWAHHDGDNLVISRFNPEGGMFSVKRVPRPAGDASLRLASAGDWWGRLSGGNTLLQFDETMNLIDEATVLAPDGARVEKITAIAGDRDGRLYLATGGKILVIEN